MAEISGNTLKDVKLALNKARSIVISIPELPTLDTAVSTKLLVDLFTKELNKPTKILVSKDYSFPERISDFVEYSKIPENLLLTKIDPLAYKIQVPEVDENTSVEWKIEDTKLEVVLKPKEGRVDLSKASFSTEGERFDMIITLGAQTEEMLTEAYTKSRDGISNMITVNLDVHSQNKRYAQVNVVDTTTSTITELVFALHKELGAKISPENAGLAMKCIVISTDGLRRIASSTTLTSLTQLEEKSEDTIKDIIHSHYISLGKKGLALREKMLKDITFERNGEIVVSTVDKATLDDLEIDPEILRGVEQLPYNICKGTKIAIMVYESKEGNWEVLAVSNADDVNLGPWAKALGGKGVANLAIARIAGNKETATQTALKTLSAEVFGESNGNGNNSQNLQVENGDDKGNDEDTTSIDNTSPASNKTDAKEKITPGKAQSDNAPSSPFEPAKEEQIKEASSSGDQAKKSGGSPFTKANSNE